MNSLQIANNVVDNETYIATAEQTEVVLGLLAPLIQGKTKAFQMVTRQQGMRQHRCSGCTMGHHLLQLLILRLLVLCATAVLRPRALQDAPALADPKSQRIPWVGSKECYVLSFKELFLYWNYKTSGNNSKQSFLCLFHSTCFYAVNNIRAYLVPI